MTKSVFSENYSIFRSLLIDARKEKGLTQSDLSECLSRPQSFVSKYESGERRIDVVEFLEIAKCLDLDPIKFIQTLIKECGEK